MLVLDPRSNIIKGVAWVVLYILDENICDLVMNLKKLVWIVGINTWVKTHRLKVAKYDVIDEIDWMFRRFRKIRIAISIGDITLVQLNTKCPHMLSRRPFNDRV